MAKQIKMEDKVNDILTQLSDKRKRDNEFIKTKQDIVKELILAQAKKELKLQA
ncbi:MAG: hypothetical protein K0U08_01510 [Proteobacteria bacterium]|nr:hypothetical protein [Pseudomonadota bacterium]